MTLILNIWDRLNQNRHVRKVTGSKITAFYAAMSLSYCFIQLLFLVTTWDINHRAGKLLETILIEARMNTTQDYSFFDSPKKGDRLRRCDGISDTLDVNQCEIIYPVANIYDPVRVNPQHSKRETALLYMSPLINNDRLTSFVIIDPENPDTMVMLPPACVRALKWPFQHLFSIRREDVVSACYQAWLLIMSCIAVFTQSIPHIGSTFVVHIIALGWSGMQLYTTSHFKRDYYRLITGPTGACNGVDLIPTYFRNRFGYQIGVTTVNFVSLMMSAYLTYRLISMYGWATFKRMGASIAISRAYKIALVISISIQLVIFFYVASVGTYIDMLTKHAFGARPARGKLYLIGYICSTVFVAPWVYLAWYGIRRESKRLMIGFFVLAAIYMGGQGAIFKSDTFRATFTHWPFLSAMFITSYILILATVILAVFCWRNFGIGLPHYFERRNGESPVDFHSEFHPTPDNRDDPEKFGYTQSVDDAPIAFPGATYGGYTGKRSGSLSSTSSRDTLGSLKKPTADFGGSYRIALPPTARTPARNLTPASSMNSNSEATKPSWQKGDDRHLWREDSASSFGNKNAGDLDRGFSVRTADYSNSNRGGLSTQPSSQVLPRRTPTNTSTKSSSSFGTKWPTAI